MREHPDARGSVTGKAKDQKACLHIGSSSEGKENSRSGVLSGRGERMPAWYPLPSWHLATSLGNNQLHMARQPASLLVYASCY